MWMSLDVMGGLVLDGARWSSSGGLALIPVISDRLEFVKIPIGPLASRCFYNNGVRKEGVSQM
jgi:hypothetical protein